MQFVLETKFENSINLRFLSTRCVYFTKHINFDTLNFWKME